MTEDDKHAAIGRMMTEYAAAKAHRATLLNEAHQMSEALGKARDQMHSVNWVEAFDDGRNTGYQARNKPIPKVETYATAERANLLLDELRAVSAEVRRLRKLIQQTGMPLD